MKLRKRQQTSSDAKSPNKRDNTAQNGSPAKRKKEPTQRKKTSKKPRAKAATGKNTSPPVISAGSSSQERNRISVVHEPQEGVSRANVNPTPVGLYRFICQWEVSIQNTSIANASEFTKIQCRRKYLRTDGPDGSIDHLVNFHLPKLLDGKSALQCSWNGCKSGEKVFATYAELKTHAASHAGDSTGLVSM